MGSASTGEEGHDAIVRRLLASQRPLAPAATPAPVRSPALLLGAARRFTADILPGLEAFAGASMTWRVRQVRAGSWDETAKLPLASPLTRDGDEGPRLAALAACDGPFLSNLMGALFGTVSPRRADPTASELCVFAQLAVRLRDGLDPGLEHAPPEKPADCMRLFAPEGAAPLVAEITATLRETEGLLLLVMTDAASARFLPADLPAPPRSASGMGRLPLAAELRLAGPRLTLREVSALAVGRTLPVRGGARLHIADRPVAGGCIGRKDGRRTLSLQPLDPKDAPHG